MNMGRRPLPWWFVVTGVVLLAIPLVAQLYADVRIPWLLVVVGCAIFYMFAVDAIIAPGRGRLEKLVAPAEVFVVEYDGGSREVLGALTGQPIAESWSFLVVQQLGLEVWTLERDPQRVGIALWSTFRGANITSSLGRRGTGTIEIALANGTAAYFDVRVRLLERIRGLGSNAAELAASLNECITPAQPAAAHTPPRAQTD